jgi:uncharacterized SAM-binding protein YcdF (DUF218 family)
MIASADVTYYVSKVFWLIAAPTNALVLISAIVALWALLRRPSCVTWSAAAVACGLVIGTFTPIGLALTLPLEKRFALSLPDSRASPDGIILLAGGGVGGIDAMSALSQRYPRARLIFSGFSPTNPVNEYLLDIFARLGGDPARIYRLPEPRTTSEDAHYSAALLKPKPSESWLLVTSALHMPRAIGCFRTAGFHVKPHPVEFRTAFPRDLFTTYSPGSGALLHFDTATKEWIGLVAYWLMGKTDTLFPGP